MRMQKTNFGPKVHRSPNFTNGPARSKMPPDKIQHIAWQKKKKEKKREWREGTRANADRDEEGL